jgi:hypothetical protein
MSLLALRYPSDIAGLTGVRSHRCFGREAMHETLTTSDDKATLVWLEDALRYASAHGEMNFLAYLEAIIEDVVFVMEMTDRRASLVGWGVSLLEDDPHRAIGCTRNPRSSGVGRIFGRSQRTPTRASD